MALSSTKAEASNTSECETGESKGFFSSWKSFPSLSFSSRLPLPFRNREEASKVQDNEKQQEKVEEELYEINHEPVPVRMEEMNRSFIDDNGNPCSDEEGEGNNLQMGESPPKYFINAAELSEDENGYNQISEQEQKEPPVPVAKPKSKVPIPAPRSRVPVSKSFPDIVQTTLTLEKEEEIAFPQAGLRKMKKDNSEDSLVADSLENIATSVEKEGKKSSVETETIDDANKKPGIGILSASALMTESQIGGIFAEKPPEAWTVDLNSLSLADSELQLALAERERRRKNSENSHAFFVNLQEDQKESEATQSMSSSTVSEKKIFSMFVDMDKESPCSERRVKSGIPQVQRVVNKPVEKLTASASSAGGRKFPSPIPQRQQETKEKAEAQRKAARLEWEMQKEKYMDSLDPAMLQQSMMMMQLEAESLGESSICLTNSNRSSLHVANVLESSFESSVISNMGNSQVEDEVCQGGPCVKLGIDLMRMFQEGINTDVNISCSGKWIKAHKCILASRSQYFAAILSGQWVAKSGNTIKLDGFSYPVVQFALYHIYSGTNEIPDSIDLLELATLTDLLGLEGLRENISQTIRVKFCHNFHRPCTGCITGVLECFPIASTYGMDELQRKMIKWICRHFVRIWPTKGFASLGEELIDKCLRYSIAHLSVDNILDHTLGCDQLNTTMPTLRWTQRVFQMIVELSEECVRFVGENLPDVLQSQKFLQFGKGQAWNISRIEGTFTQALDLLKPDVACLSHTALSRLIELGTETIEEVEWSTNFVDFLKMLRNEVEKYLLANAGKAVLTKAWENLGPSIRKKICSTSFVGHDKQGNKLPSKNKKSPSTPQAATPTSVVAPSQRGKKESKVASVRPIMQVPKTLSSTVGRSSTMSSTRSDTESTTTTSNTITVNRPTGTVSALNKTTLRRDSLSRRSNISSPTRSRTNSATVSKAGTPSVPSKPGPSAPNSSGSATKRATSATVTRTQKQTNSLSRQTSEPEPQKKFLTNSAKAAAVSRPILKATPKRPEIESPKDSGRDTGRSAPSSASSAGRSGVKSKVDSNLPAVASYRKTPASQAQSQIPPKTSTTNTTNLQKRPVSSSKMTPRGKTQNASNTNTASNNKQQGRKPQNQQRHHDFEPDSLMEVSHSQSMSKSTIEDTGNEVKMRTLAEIGRSSTFSKDEPTVLGKMGFGVDMNMDVDYNQHDDYDYEDDYEDPSDEN